MNRRRFVGVALLAGALAWAPPLDAREPQTLATPVSIDVEATPFASFELREPELRRFGRLTFRGGVRLTSAFKQFGGISSIRVLDGGERFIAVTDKGWWLRGRITYSDKAPSGMADVEMAPLLGVDGRPLAQRGWFDSESLALDGDVAYVGLERVHQIVRFDLGREGLSARGRPIATLPALKELPANQSLESLAFVPKGFPLAGTLIAISERGLDRAGDIRAFLIGGPKPGAFSVRRSDDFDITDAAITPAGDLLIIERKFSLLSGPGIRIRRLRLDAIAPGATADGETLIVADAGFEIDNMEGLSAHRGADGRTVLTLVSDDNFSSLQRTLLMQFTLTE